MLLHIVHLEEHMIMGKIIKLKYQIIKLLNK